jgi:hypothetical protein
LFIFNHEDTAQGGMIREIDPSAYAAWPISEIPKRKYSGIGF